MPIECRYGGLSERRYGGWRLYLLGQDMRPIAEYPNRRGAREAERALCREYLARTGSLPPASIIC
jgi:hypothetical protein